MDRCALAFSFSSSSVSVLILLGLDRDWRLDENTLLTAYAELTTLASTSIHRWAINLQA